jgi:hypothetical protein
MNNLLPDAHVVIPFGNGFIALSPEQFHEALERGRSLMPTHVKSDTCHADDRIVDAAGAAAITSVPESWFEERARRGDIPHLKFGKYVRFRIVDVLEAASFRKPDQNRNLSAIASINQRRGIK